jgi:ATP-dependent DNA helicase RecG
MANSSPTVSKSGTRAHSPKALTLADLRRPHSSIPGNPLLAEPLYLTKYIERMGTGTRDMIRKCLAAGLSEPEFTLTDSFVTTIRKPVAAGKTPRQDQTTGQVTGQVDPVTDPVTDPVGDPVNRIVLALAAGEMAPSTLWERLGLKHRPTFRENYLRPALAQKLIERTIPDKPNSRLQKYRLTNKGKALWAKIKK